MVFMSFSKLVDVLINLRKFTVIKIKCSGIVSVVAKYFCHKGKIFCYAGNREYGICLPDVSVYVELCEILGISLNEFLAGEDIEIANVEKNRKTP